MYDRVTIRLDGERLPCEYDWRTVLSRTESRMLYARGDGGRGVWRGGWVTARSGYVEFRGSITKSLLGHNCNISPIRLSDVRGLLDGMSEDFGVPMEQAEVTDLELAANFVMRCQPSAYSDMVTGVDGYDDWNIRGTRYVDRKDYVRLKFYDKGKDARKKKELPETGLVPPNLLRYEVTFHARKLREMFGVLRAGDLWDRETYWMLISEWLYYFDNVRMRSDGDAVDFQQFHNLQGFVSWVLCRVDGRENLINSVKGLFSSRPDPVERDRQVHRDIKRRIMAAREWGKSHLRESGLASELRTAVESYLTGLYGQLPDGMAV